jgi:hypothetical protein
MRSSIQALSTASNPGACFGQQARVAGQPGMSTAIGSFHEAAVRLDNDDGPCEWDEADIVLLHWRLLKEVAGLRHAETPLEEKLDTLRWVFTEREKEGKPFSFVNCLRVVGCSPLSPTPYFGLVDAEEVRDAIRCQVKSWLNATLSRYPAWVRDAVFSNPAWIESRLAKNPQWINEQVKKHAMQGDLFA